MKRLILAFAFLAAVAPAPVAFAGDPLGTWLTAGGDSHIEIYECGDSLCGRIAMITEPLEKDGQPKLDKNNPDESLRSQPLVGLTIISQMKPDGKPNEWQGVVYNPEDGNTYTAYMKYKSQNALLLEGCLAGIFCQTQTWTRVN